MTPAPRTRPPHIITRHRRLVGVAGGEDPDHDRLLGDMPIGIDHQILDRLIGAHATTGSALGVNVNPDPNDPDNTPSTPGSDTATTVNG